MSRLIAFGAFLIIGLILAATVQIPPIDRLRELAAHFGAWFVVIFTVAYVLITQFPIPRTALTVASGVLFGTIGGIAVALSATTLAAFLALTWLRKLVAANPEDGSAASLQWAKKWFSSSRQQRRLDQIHLRLSQRGAWTVFFLRLIPGIPFSLLNYACVFTPIKRRDFSVATLFGSAPSTIIGVLLGDSLATGDSKRALWMLAGLGLIGITGLAADFLLPVKSQA